MPNKSFFERVPAIHREELRKRFNQICLDEGFQGYETVILEQVNRLLDEYGLDFSVSKSTVHKYGKEFEQLIENVRRQDYELKALSEEFEDNEANVEGAISKIVLSRFYDFLVTNGKIKDENQALKMTKALRELMNANLSQKKYNQEVKAKIKTKVAEVEDKQRQLGASEEVIAQTKILLGVVDDN